MKTLFTLSVVVALLLASVSNTNAQVKISTDNNPPDNSAMLDVTSTSKGFLPPRMTFAQRNAITNPAEGLIVICTNCSSSGIPVISVYLTGKWLNVSSLCEVPSNPVAGTHIPICTQITWNWNTVPIALGYKWNTVNVYATAMDMGTSTTKTETGLTCNTPYTRYVWAYNLCGNSTATILTQTTSINPSSPIAGTHVPSNTQIVWNWNPVTGATGYKWNAIDDYGTATDMGTATTKTETGLTCGTAYTRYIWAYNSCGYSASTTLTQSTLAWSCGCSITINHVVGTVAPISKTVTYGTVTNIPGETSKCWITSNLGADHQATAKNDTSEASAGWYWQFNRKQGYKHDGTTRTPNTTWINYINENLDWQSANDPCTLELGSDWRIPTYNEWFNVDATGGWTEWNGPWNSGLKLHGAGFLYFSDGSLGYRGMQGHYWSSIQYSLYSSSYGWYLYFDNGLSGIGGDRKWYGFTLRCIRE